MAVDDIGDLIEHPKDLVSYDFETLQRNVILSGGGPRSAGQRQAVGHR